MTKTSSAGAGIFVASAIAGPIFLICTGLATAYLEIPDTIDIDLSYLASMTLIVLLAAIFGLFIALPANAIGTGLMILAGKAAPSARSATVWAATGGLLGASVAFLLDEKALPAVQFGLIATGAICARTCRWFVAWEDDDVPAAPMCSGYPPARVIP